MVPLDFGRYSFHLFVFRVCSGVYLAITEGGVSLTSLSSMKGTMPSRAGRGVWKLLPSRGIKV